MSDNKVTNLVKPASDLLNWTKTKLSAHESWNTYKYSGTSSSNLLSRIPELILPVAVVTSQGANFNNEAPRRTSTIGIIVAVEDYGDIDQAANELLPLVDKAMELLDHEVYDDILFRVTGSSPIDMGSENIAAYEVTFTAEDY